MMVTTSTATQEKMATDESDCEKVAHILDMIVDGEATNDDESYFFRHVESCVPCMEAHQRQKLLKEIVQGNVKRMQVPASLINSIKTMIQKTA